MALVGMAGAANYMYEKANIKGVGYKNAEVIIQTQTGLAGNKLIEKESGSGNVINQRMELEVNRDPGLPAVPATPETRTALAYYYQYISGIGWVSFKKGDVFTEKPYGLPNLIWNSKLFFKVNPGTPGKPAGPNPNCHDYINFTKEAEFEYMPVSYQTGTYDHKWIEKLCVQNYYIGAVVVEMYTHAEHLQKTTEVKTRRNMTEEVDEDCGNCTGALEANFNSNVIGVAHLGWLSKDPMVNAKGRHNEYGRSVEDLTGVFSIEKFIQLWGNDTCGAVQVDWLPCI
jgi:hypothetical protein